MFGWFRHLIRGRLRRKPVPESWRKILKGVRLYRRLGPQDRAELEGHIQVFLAEKRFEGCGGLQLAEEMKVVIAAQACVLLLHREAGYFPGLESILVYPASYFAKTEQAGPAGTISEYDEQRLGESWAHGTIVLSWEDVEAAATGREEESSNVVLHEFAHQLDVEDENLDGTPVLADSPQYASWSSIMEKEFEALQEDADAGADTVIDPYGAKDPAEFFAVITEAFFENPQQLRKRHSALYGELKKYYRQDPANWGSQ